MDFMLTRSTKGGESDDRGEEYRLLNIEDFGSKDKLLVDKSNQRRRD